VEPCLGKPMTKPLPLLDLFGKHLRFHGVPRVGGPAARVCHRHGGPRLCHCRRTGKRCPPPLRRRGPVACFPPSLLPLIFPLLFGFVDLLFSHLFCTRTGFVTVRHTRSVWNRIFFRRENTPVTSIKTAFSNKTWLLLSLVFSPFWPVTRIFQQAY